MSTGLTTTKQTTVATSTTQTPSATIQTTTTTTVTSSQYDNGVIDISIIPYIPNRQVSFIARGLRPNRQVWFNFDGQDVTPYIIKPDYLRLNESSDSVPINSKFAANIDLITAGTGAANTAPLISFGRYFDTGNANVALQDTGDSRSRKRVFHLHTGIQTTGKFIPGQSITVQSTGNTGTIDYYESHGGANLASWFASPTANTVRLPIRTIAMANNFWGTDGSNTITFIPGKQVGHPTLTSNIVGFNNVTQTLTLSSLTGTLANLTAGIANPVTANTPAGDIGWSIGQTFFTDDEGQISGIFNIPAGVFRTGERIFRIIDDPINDTTSATTYADYKFDATGLQETKDSVILQATSVSSVQSITPVVVPSTPTTSTSSNNRNAEGKVGGTAGTAHAWDGTDPVAQSFYVASDMFVTSIDVFFRSKDNILPVTVDIRPMVNGYPSSIGTVPLGVSVVLAEHVKLSNVGSDATNFKFATPVYLPAGEYAFVVSSDSLEYELFVAELGGTIIGTTRSVSASPYSGVLFKSKNNYTWDAIQTEVMTFNIYQAQFVSSGTAQLSSVLPAAGGSDIVIDKFLTHLNGQTYKDTELSYQHSYPGQGLTSYKLDNEVIPPSGRVLLNSGTSPYNLDVTLTTTNQDVSPVIYPSTAQLITFQNYVDNANLAQSDFTIVTPLGGFPANANIALTINSLAGSGAVAYGNANSSGYLTSIQLAAGGQLYTDNVTVSVGANTGYISLGNETGFSGGPAEAKYISRSVTLADGFDANDLKVFITAYKPTGTDILVYYKIKAATDPDPFTRKPWVKMQLNAGTQEYSTSGSFENDQIEYEWDMVDTAGGQTGITYTSGAATYTYFNTFAIKIVLISSDTTNVPVLYNARAVALPL